MLISRFSNAPQTLVSHCQLDMSPRMPISMSCPKFNTSPSIVQSFPNSCINYHQYILLVSLSKKKKKPCSYPWLPSSVWTVSLWKSCCVWQQNTVKIRPLLTSTVTVFLPSFFLQTCSSNESLFLCLHLQQQQEWFSLHVSQIMLVC